MADVDLTENTYFSLSSSKTVNNHVVIFGAVLCLGPVPLFDSQQEPFANQQGNTYFSLVTSGHKGALENSL